MQIYRILQLSPRVKANQYIVSIKGLRVTRKRMMDRSIDVISNQTLTFFLLWDDVMRGRPKTLHVEAKRDIPLGKNDIVATTGVLEWWRHSIVITFQRREVVNYHHNNPMVADCISHTVFFLHLFLLYYYLSFISSYTFLYRYRWCKGKPQELAAENPFDSILDSLLSRLVLMTINSQRFYGNVNAFDIPPFASRKPIHLSIFSTLFLMKKLAGTKLNILILFQS